MKGQILLWCMAINCFTMPFAVLGCKESAKPKPDTTYSYSNPKFKEYYDFCLELQFETDHPNSTIIIAETKEQDNYYLSSICYHIDFDNNVYGTNYIGAIKNQELIIKEIRYD